MPTYDYECDACEHSFELFQTISESLKKKCPECGKMKLRRLFGTGVDIQGFRLLPDGLPERIVQEGRQGGQEV